MEAAPEGCPRGPALRLGHEDPREVQEPLRAPAFVLDHVRGAIANIERRHAETDSDAAREKLEQFMRQDPVPLVQGRAPAAGDPRRDARRTQHRRAHRALDPRHARVRGDDGPHRARGDDRRTAGEGDPRAVGLPGRRRARLPDPRPCRGDARWGRSAADPPGHPDRQRARRRAVHPGRAVDRAAPARQPAADRHAGAAPRPGEHAHRRRARRGHDPRGRPHRGHRSAGGRGGRTHRVRRRPRRAAQVRAVHHRRVPVGPPRDPRACRRAAARGTAACGWRASASTTSAT